MGVKLIICHPHAIHRIISGRGFFSLYRRTEESADMLTGLISYHNSMGIKIINIFWTWKIKLEKIWVEHSACDKD